MAKSGIDRRDFLQTIGCSTLASMIAIPTMSSWQPFLQSPSKRRARVAVLAEPNFPTVDIAPISSDTLRQALADFEVAFLTAKELRERLTPENFDLYINPYGSAFPKEAWLALLQYLTAGGNWVNLGGVPFAVPVVRTNNGWRQEIRQAAYHKKLGITQAFSVNTSNTSTWRVNDKLPWSSELVGKFAADIVYEFYLRFTNTKEFPNEDGSSGPRDAVIQPLVSGVDENDFLIAAPFIQIDRWQGEFAGGRWLLATLDGTIASPAIRTLSLAALLGSHQLEVRPNFACYREGEIPSIKVTYKSGRSTATGKVDVPCQLEVFDEKNATIAKTSLQISGTAALASGQSTLKPIASQTLKPGLYRVEAQIPMPGNESGLLRETNGFWVYDPTLLASGKPLTANQHTLLRDGEAYPVTGTTYMSSDTHRKFLLEPNPHLWDQAFAEMKQVGINMVRTGIWTAWKSLMLDVGAPNEAVLRALDAFFLTARRYDIPVIFTFFAFLPETWGGENAYLDPRSVKAQKTFIGLITQRYSEMNDVIWDLINEPSFCSPNHLWSCRPNYDRYEVKAWTDWLKARFPAATDQERETRLQEMWRTMPGESLNLPRLEEFSDRAIFNEARPLKVLEYRLFAQEMFGRWVKEMTTAIRSNGNLKQLVTVGQDEGGTYDSPNNQFLSETVDFTCIHNWWANDDLLWDSVVTKSPGKSNLIQETGVMFYEKVDGSPWRTEEEARNLLERKLALGLGVSGAGFIEWLWNTNLYMPSDNEAAIGLLRPDGTAKPELTVMRGVAAFASTIKPWLKTREPEPVVMVIPHSNMFSVRNTAIESTKRAVRAMHYHCRVPMAAVSEYNLATLHEVPRLIILPSPRILREDAWTKLLAWVEQGTTLVISGPINHDEHWLPIPRLDRLGVKTQIKPVTQEEHLKIGEAEYRLGFRGDKIQKVEKSVVIDATTAAVTKLSLGQGNILWSPIPVELAHEVEPAAAFYQYGIKQAGMTSLLSAHQADPSILIYPTVYQEAVLFTIVSENDRVTRFGFTHPAIKSNIEVNLPAQRAVMILVSRKDGRALASYRGK